MTNIINKFSVEKKNKIVCNRNILLSIISLATKEISGVSGMDNRISSRLRDKLCWNYYDGALVRFRKDGTVDIDVYINIFVNYNVSEIAYKIQENIRSGVTSMLNLKIKNINIHIVGVVMDENTNLG